MLSKSKEALCLCIAVKLWWLGNLLSHAPCCSSSDMDPSCLLTTEEGESETKMRFQLKSKQQKTAQQRHDNLSKLKKQMDKGGERRRYRDVVSKQWVSRAMCLRCYSRQAFSNLENELRKSLLYFHAHTFNTIHLAQIKCQIDNSK